MPRRLAAFVFLFAAFLVAALPVSLAAQTLAGVQARGGLLCGIDRSEAEYSATDEHGERKAFDRDLCRAVAVAALGAGAKVQFTYYADDAESRRALLDGRADVIASLSKPRIGQITGEPAEKATAYTDAVLYDPVQVMVPTASGITALPQLSARKICFLTETHTEDALRHWFLSRELDLLPFPFQEEGEMEAAWVTGNCTGIAGDSTRLAETRAATGPHAGEYTPLPEQVGEDTLGFAYRSGDAAWGALLAETRHVLLAAEAASITQATAKAATAGIPALASSLPPQRVRELLQATGNYGELFSRDLGADSDRRLSRAANGARLVP